MFVLAPFGALCIALGILPKQTVFDYMNGTLDNILAHIAPTITNLGG